MEEQKIEKKKKEKKIDLIDKTKNPNPKLCDKYMISKNKFCKFEKYKASIFCNFHISIKVIKIKMTEKSLSIVQ